jgi:hypothetical protein
MLEPNSVAAFSFTKMVARGCVENLERLQRTIDLSRPFDSFNFHCLFIELIASTFCSLTESKSSGFNELRSDNANYNLKYMYIMHI